MVRYFEPREAVYFELLLQALDEWLAELLGEIPEPAASPRSVVEALASSLAQRPLICEMLSALGTQMARKISVEAVREFKLAHEAWQDRAAELLKDRLPTLGEHPAREFVSLAIVLTAGLGPFSRPAPAVVEALRDPRLARARDDFSERLGRALRVTVAGLLEVPGRDAPRPGS